MKRLVHYAQRRAASGFYRAISAVRDFDPRKNLLIFSDPRGGSTWLTEMISQVPGTAVLWEPLHLRKVGLFNDVGFCWRQHIPEDEEWKEAEKAFRRVFRGKVLNRWICPSPGRFLKADRLVVKLCRANAMIPWLTKTFKFEYDPVYLVRHPFSVAASQLKHGAWDGTSRNFEIPEGRFCELYHQHADYLSTLGTDYEVRVATWCLTNLIPLRSERNNKSWITVHYEDLLVDSGKETRRIFDRWGLPVPRRAAERLRKPSATAKELTFLEGVEAQLSKWRTTFTQAEIKRMSQVLDYFEIECYTADDVFPRVSSWRGSHGLEQRSRP